MANKILTSDIIADAALILLKNTLVMPNLVYRNHEKVFGKVGDAIKIEKPFRAKASMGATLNVQPLVDVTVPLAVSNHATVGLNYGTREMTLDIKNFSSKYLKSPVTSIANLIDRSLLLELKKAYHSTGTPGTTAGTFGAFSNAQSKMSTYGVPQEGMRRAISSPDTCAALSNDIARLNNPMMVKDAWKTGQVNKVAGFDLFESNNIPTHTVGNYSGTPKVYNTQSNGNTITTDGWTAGVTGLLNVGDVFTMTGVFGVNPQNYESTGKLQDFVVTETANSDGSARATIKVSPSMNDGSATTLNGDGVSVSLAASQNITNLPINNAVITVQGTAGTTYEQNYLFHRDALSLAMINLEPPPAANVAESVYDPDSGLAMLMTADYSTTTGMSTTRLEAVWAAGLVYPDLAMRLWGGSQ